MAARDQIKKTKTKPNKQKPPNKTHKQKKSEKELKTPAVLRIQVFSRKFLERAKQLPADVDKLVVFMKKK